MLSDAGRAYQDFSGVLGTVINDALTFDNNGGFMSVGFHCVPPTGSIVFFEGSYDGANFDTCLMRGTTTNAYTSQTAVTGFFVGSIANFRTFRIRTTTTGSVAGAAGGRAHKQVNTLEGVEQSNAPHRFGEVIVRRDASFTTQQTGAILWTPSSGKKFVVTDFMVTASGTTDARVTIFDETNSQGNRLYNGFLDLSATSPALIVAPALRTPFVSGAVNNNLRLTTSVAINIDVGIHGYEIF